MTVQIKPDPGVLAEQARAFREELRPFGLDKFVLSDEPSRVLNASNGRVLAEYRTMLLPVWQQEKLNALAAAGFNVEVVTRRYESRPPQVMYYVRSVREIWRKM